MTKPLVPLDSATEKVIVEDLASILQSMRETTVKLCTALARA